MPNAEYSVLVVDDLPDWRMTLSGMLTDEGYKVETAGSVAGALELLKDSHFDLALLDARLDELDENNIEGFNLAVEIRRHWPDAKIIIMTGYADVSMVVQALKRDTVGQPLADSFFEKSSSEALLEVVQELIKK